MTFRSEGDIVYAANAARDLTSLVTAYLTLYRKYAQGMNGVRVPDQSYTVVILPLRHEGKLHVKLVYTSTDSYQEPVYYDLDDENRSDSWGSDNISHYATMTSTHIEEDGILIPMAILLQSKEKMEESVKTFAQNEKNRLQEIERRSRIAAHQEAIRKLQEESL